MLKHCNLCDRNVQPRRQIGFGTFLMIVITGGVWILVIPFYPKRCPVCKGGSLSDIDKGGN